MSTLSTMHELAARIEDHILRRTYGKVHDLCVELCGDAVLLRGCTTTYYAKQLAQEAVRDVLPLRTVSNAIQVGFPASRQRLLDCRHDVD